MACTRRYRKKPVVVEAIRYDPPRNCEEVWRFLGWPWPQPEQHKDCYHDDEACGDDVPVYLETLEGEMECLPGDWIIKGVKGDFCSVCNPDVFAATYEPVEDDPVAVTADALRDRIARAIESVAHEPGGRPCELCVETADAVLAALADADPTDLGFKWVDGITYCTFHDATVTAERARTGACDRAHHFCAEVPVYARPRPEEAPDAC